MNLDLSFVPGWFWSSFWGWSSYVVVATGHGLVCISNGHQIPHKMKPGEEACKADRYCVLNPLTRTCVVLPADLPFRPDRWLLPTSATVAIWSASASGSVCRLATYDLAAGADACWVWAHKLVLNYERSCWSPMDAMTGPRAAGPGRGAGGQAASQLGDDVLSATLLGLDETYACGCVAQVSEHTLGVVHGGAVYWVAQLLLMVASDQAVPVPVTRRNALCGVWRVAVPASASGGMEWEVVALLRAACVLPARVLQATPGAGRAPG